MLNHSTPFHSITLLLMVIFLLLNPSCGDVTWMEGAYGHPIYYRRFGFPSRPLKHGPTPKIDKEVQERIRAFIDPFYIPTPPSWEDVKPYLKDKGIDYPDMRVFHPSIVGRR